MEQVLSTNQDEEADKNQTAALKLSTEKIFLTVSVITAFLLRFFCIPRDTVINGDGVYYATLGEKLASGDLYGGISGYWSPFYSFLVGVSSFFFQDLEFAGRFVSVLASTLLTIPAYLLIREFYGRNAAYLGTILLVFHPEMLNSSVWVMTEAVYSLIFTTVVLVGWHALRTGSAKIFLICGLLWGLAYLTKPEALGFLGLLFILTLGAVFFRRRIGFRRYAAGYLLILAGFVVFFAPYVIFLKYKTGQWTVSQKIMVNLPAFDYDRSFLEITGDGQLTMQDRIWGDRYDIEIQPAPTPAPPAAADNELPPSRWSKLKNTFAVLGEKALFLFKKQFRDYLPVLLPYPFILIAIIGFFYRPLTKYRLLREFYLGAFFVCMLLGYAMSAVELRYLYPLLPILLAWVARGIVKISDWTVKSLSNVLKTKTPIKPLPFQIALVLFFIILFAPFILMEFQSARWQDVPFEEKQAGLWIKQNAAGNSSPVVMSANATPAFYARGTHLFLPNEDFSTVVEYAKRKEVDYLVFGARRTKSVSRAFPPDEQNVPPELRLTFRSEENPEYKILVYQIVR